jgi:hypothetical protein
MDNPLVLWSTRILVYKWASHSKIIDKSDNPNFVFDFNYNNISNAWNKVSVMYVGYNENVMETKINK